MDKDYLRLAKSESMAALLFKKKLAGPSGNILYIVSEKEQLALLPENCLRVLVTAELETIRKRFAQRMHGQLPAPAAAMLERRHGQFDSEPHALHINMDVQSADEACALILARIG